jgi:hypothetical protein
MSRWNFMILRTAEFAVDRAAPAVRDSGSGRTVLRHTAAAHHLSAQSSLLASLGQGPWLADHIHGLLNSLER